MEKGMNKELSEAELKEELEDNQYEEKEKEKGKRESKMNLGTRAHHPNRIKCGFAKSFLQLRTCMMHGLAGFVKCISFQKWSPKWHKNGLYPCLSNFSHSQFLPYSNTCTINTQYCSFLIFSKILFLSSLYSQCGAWRHNPGSTDRASQVPLVLFFKWSHLFLNL